MRRGVPTKLTGENLWVLYALHTVWNLGASGSFGTCGKTTVHGVTGAADVPALHELLEAPAAGRRR